MCEDGITYVGKGAPAPARERRPRREPAAGGSLVKCTMWTQRERPERAHTTTARGCCRCRSQMAEQTEFTRLSNKRRANSMRPRAQCTSSARQAFIAWGAGVVTKTRRVGSNCRGSRRSPWLGFGVHLVVLLRTYAARPPLHGRLLLHSPPEPSLGPSGCGLGNAALEELHCPLDARNDGITRTRWAGMHVHTTGALPWWSPLGSRPGLV